MISIHHFRRRICARMVVVGYKTKYISVSCNGNVGGA